MGREHRTGWSRRPSGFSVGGGALGGVISGAGERVFLSEAITCYRHEVCRAAIAMTWNVPVDRLVTGIFADEARLAAFNATLFVRLGGKRWAGFAVNTRDDLEELTESQVIQICGHARLVSGSVFKTLKGQAQAATSCRAAVACGDHAGTGG